MTLLRAAMLTCIVAALFLTSMMRPPSFADDVTANDITLKHSLHQHVVIRRTSVWETGIAEKSPNTLDILIFDQELHAAIYRIKAYCSEPPSCIRIVMPQKPRSLWPEPQIILE